MELTDSFIQIIFTGNLLCARSVIFNLFHLMAHIN